MFWGLAPSPSSGRTDVTLYINTGQMSAGLYQFYLRMGLEPVTETLYLLNHLTRLMAREDYEYIKYCHAHLNLLILVCMLFSLCFRHKCLCWKEGSADSRVCGLEFYPDIVDAS
jgi:hypothetical protein